MNSIRIFNPEHDFALAVNDESFVPPLSSLNFGHDCQSILRFLNDDSPIVLWGWDKTIRRHLLKSGVDPSLLPSDEELSTIRELSHRRTSIRCTKHILSGQFRDELWCRTDPVEAFSINEIDSIVNSYHDTFLKSPWSSSGRGLRPVRSKEWTQSDRGWCEKTLAKQGSVIIERRKKVDTDFSFQFRIEKRDVVFLGYSIFNTKHGAYTGNLLASNDFMHDYICRKIPEDLLLFARKSISTFLQKEFCGRYIGCVGVDMFIDNEARLVPCVEINVRNNMGVIARNLYDTFFPLGYDGIYEMSVIYSANREDLKAKISESEMLLTDFTDNCHYAIIVQKSHLLSLL